MSYGIFLRTIGLLLSISLASSAFSRVYVVVSVDWEGRDVSERNIKAMENLRWRYSQVPLLHFVSAAYWTKKNLNRRGIAELNEKVARAFRPGDELGLHFHSWKSLADNFNVPYRHFPKWTPSEYHQQEVRACRYQDCGHEVPMWAYDEEELRILLSGSRDILQKQFASDQLKEFNFPTIESFRAGGWMADDKVRKVLMDLDFTMDSSEVPRKLFKNILNRYQIPTWVDQLWPEAEVINTGFYPLASNNYNTLYELSDNGCLADYMNAHEMLEVFKENARAQKENPDRDYYVSIGFHQETASRYVHRIEKAINLIEKWAEREEVDWGYLDLPVRYDLP